MTIDQKLDTLAILVSAQLGMLAEDGPDYDALAAVAAKVRAGMEPHQAAAQEGDDDGHGA